MNPKKTCLHAYVYQTPLDLACKNNTQQNIPSNSDEQLAYIHFKHRNK